ncbi:ABC transporter [Streptomyces agglomeratus]|uniref:ABC transporter n=1 Tax=Streptomyces agglomeratus TaxID=285458 RepID=A0A1E5PD46_9ACTN|nr:ABC transporter permease [Streptomyces agglomeratus]OEJ27447.1 ABC transporter [Streptomyces agglomeratus]OEJ38495.1 ABC transporter [Streptomyces agglomeratus]OEJ47119.1 ABC transporter [Streptomyces agglomeratus]OEJ51024.1 ABC transporter [Streptomyces agglomeratus]OEJ58394.1 ABC transporter [Streptomyces agglomeratus]
MSTGTYTPRPGAAPLLRMITAQTLFETKMLLRNGEQLLLTVIIPALLLVLFSAVDIITVPVETAGGSGEAVDFLAPGILALAVMSTAFTGQAIATGFERRYGVLKLLCTSPLPRWALMTAKTLSVLVTEVLQVVLLTVIAFGLGWSPHGSPFSVLLLLVLGTAAFSGLGLLMAGTLKAEATLAAANLVFLLLLVGGGVIVPLDKFPDAAQAVLGLLPISALSDGLRDVLQHGAAVPWGALGILSVWAVLGLGAAARFFRWE